MTQNTSEANRLITAIVAGGLGAGREIDRLIELIPASHWLIVELAGEIEHNKNLGTNVKDVRLWISEIKDRVNVPDTIVDIVRAASVARESARLRGDDTRPKDDLLESKRQVFVKSGSPLAARLYNLATLLGYYQIHHHRSGRRVRDLVRQVRVLAE